MNEALKNFRRVIRSTYIAKADAFFERSAASGGSIYRKDEGITRIRSANPWRRFGRWA